MKEAKKNETYNWEQETRKGQEVDITNLSSCIDAFASSSQTFPILGSPENRWALVFIESEDT